MEGCPAVPYCTPVHDWAGDTFIVWVLEVCEAVGVTGPLFDVLIGRIEPVPGPGDGVKSPKIPEREPPPEPPPPEKESKKAPLSLNRK